VVFLAMSHSAHGGWSHESVENKNTEGEQCNAHYNAERIHQGLDQEIPIPLSPKTRQSGPVQRTSRLGGLLNYYH